MTDADFVPKPIFRLIIMGIEIKFIFVWFDLWIGLYFDPKSKSTYVCPLPCCVFVFSRAVPHQDQPPQYYLIKKDELTAGYVAPMPQTIYERVLGRPAGVRAEPVLDDLITWVHDNTMFLMPVGNFITSEKIIAKLQKVQQEIRGVEK